MSTSRAQAVENEDSAETYIEGLEFLNYFLKQKIELITNPDTFPAEEVDIRREFIDENMAALEASISNAKRPTSTIPSAREMELSNYVDNLKWGFKRREESLKEQVEQHKRVVIALYTQYNILRDHFKSVCNAVCENLEQLEGYSERRSDQLEAIRLSDHCLRYLRHDVAVMLENSTAKAEAAVQTASTVLNGAVDPTTTNTALSTTADLQPPESIRDKRIVGVEFLQDLLTESVTGDMLDNDYSKDIPNRLDDTTAAALITVHRQSPDSLDDTSDAADAANASMQSRDSQLTDDVNRDTTSTDTVADDLRPGLSVHSSRQLNVSTDSHESEFSFIPHVRDIQYVDSAPASPSAHVHKEQQLAQKPLLKSLRRLQSITVDDADEAIEAERAVPLVSVTVDGDSFSLPGVDINQQNRGIKPQSNSDYSMTSFQSSSDVVGGDSTDRASLQPTPTSEVHGSTEPYEMEVEATKLLPLRTMSTLSGSVDFAEDNAVSIPASIDSLDLVQPRNASTTNKNDQTSLPSASSDSNTVNNNSNSYLAPASLIGHSDDGNADFLLRVASSADTVPVQTRVELAFLSLDEHEIVKLDSFSNDAAAVAHSSYTCVDVVQSPVDEAGSNNKNKSQFYATDSTSSTDDSADNFDLLATVNDSLVAAPSRSRSNDQEATHQPDLVLPENATNTVENGVCTPTATDQTTVAPAETNASSNAGKFRAFFETIGMPLSQPVVAMTAIPSTIPDRLRAEEAADKSVAVMVEPQPNGTVAVNYNNNNDTSTTQLLAQVLSLVDGKVRETSTALHSTAMEMDSLRRAHEAEVDSLLDEIRRLQRALRHSQDTMLANEGTATNASADDGLDSLAHSSITEDPVLGVSPPRTKAAFSDHPITINPFNNKRKNKRNYDSSHENSTHHTPSRWHSHSKDNTHDGLDAADRQLIAAIEATKLNLGRTLFHLYNPSTLSLPMTIMPRRVAVDDSVDTSLEYMEGALSNGQLAHTIMSESTPRRQQQLDRQALSDPQSSTHLRHQHKLTSRREYVLESQLNQALSQLHDIQQHISDVNAFTDSATNGAATEQLIDSPKLANSSDNPTPAVYLAKGRNEQTQLNTEPLRNIQRLVEQISSDNRSATIRAQPAIAVGLDPAAAALSLSPTELLSQVVVILDTSIHTAFDNNIANTAAVHESLLVALTDLRDQAERVRHWACSGDNTGDTAAVDPQRPTEDEFRTVLRERDLLRRKLRDVIERDRDSFQLRLYASAEDGLSLDNPTDTMAAVMGFVENNNELLDRVQALEAVVEERNRSIDSLRLTEADSSREINLLSAENTRLREKVEVIQRSKDSVGDHAQLFQDRLYDLSNQVRQLELENEFLKCKPLTY